MTNLAELKLFATRPHACSYLADQQATTLFVDPAATIDANLYTGLSQCGFRRSGSHFYRPHCEDCKACISVRVPVHSFNPNRTQRRCLKRNKDLEVQATSQPNIDEHYSLYERYIDARHKDGDMYPPTRQQYATFLNNPLNCTRYLEFRHNNKLIACAVSDTLSHGLSAVYTYYCPDETERSLGRLAVLHQIERAKNQALEYLYLGYWIKDSAKMRYKTEYRPLQLLINQQWVTAT